MLAVGKTGTGQTDENAHFIGTIAQGQATD
jgi:hypothetical protein